MKLIKILKYTPEKEREFHDLRIASKSGLSTIGESILHDMGMLDGKSAALLTFISVVLAALTFGLTVVEGKTLLAEIVRLGFYAFMATFALAAAIDIRCVYTLGRDDFPQNPTDADYAAVLLSEITIRRRRYSLALQIVRTGGTLLLLFLLGWLVLSFFLLKF